MLFPSKRNNFIFFSFPRCFSVSTRKASSSSSLWRGHQIRKEKEEKINGSFLLSKRLLHIREKEGNFSICYITSSSVRVRPRTLGHIFDGSATARDGKVPPIDSGHSLRETMFSDGSVTHLDRDAVQSW